MADRCHATSCATCVLYSTAHVSWLGPAAKSRAWLGLWRVLSLLHCTRVVREVAYGIYRSWWQGRNVIVWGACPLCDLIGYFSDSIGWLSRDPVIPQVMFARYTEFSMEIYGSG